tara:strand:- start:215 stop:1270 length:1056 start_codon:yes stop_codon:yes gene_type:complete
MTEVLLNQGGYGCVYLGAKPSNKLSPNKNSDYVSKVQINRGNIKQEQEIGKLVKNITNYGSFFAPIIETSPVQTQDINLSLTDKNGEYCKIVEKAKEKQAPLVMMKIPYIPEGDFKKHILTNSTGELISCYRHLLLGVEHLINKNIVHYDLKVDNILFHNRLNNPIIIDFGLSFDVKKNLTKYDNNTLKQVFYTHEPKYSLWPLDVHFLCFIANNKENTSITKEVVNNICSDYVKNAFQNDTPQEQKDYKTKAITYYSKLITEHSIKKQNIAETLCGNWKTWDLYGLHYMFYKLSNHLDKQGNPQDKQSNPDIFLSHIHKIFKQQLDPDPTQRKSTSELMDKISEIYYLSN